MPPLQAIIVGAGARGYAYSRYALTNPEQLKIIAIAEPIEERRRRLAIEHDVAPSQLYHSWQDIPQSETIADVAINCTMDRTHFASTMALLETGYDVLLEKPMSPILKENVHLVQFAEEQGRLLQICHVLRYAPFWQKLREIVQSGKLGRIISVTHQENLIYWHMAHSFVRGNWRNVASSGPMILSKCCHDFDILYWVLQKKVVWLNAFGSLIYFKPENAPEGATQHCTDGCPVTDTCKYYAPRLYISDKNSWPFNAVSLTPTIEARQKALETSPYGRCVYYCDNDVVDHQTVNMELEDGTTVTLTMQGQGNEEGRTMRYDGTQATLYGQFIHGKQEISIHEHHTGKVEHIQIDEGASGHGGGDFGIVQSFLNAVQGNPDNSVTTARESLESHLLAFAAEEARLNHSTVYMPDFRQQMEEAAKTYHEQ